MKRAHGDRRRPAWTLGGSTVGQLARRVWREIWADEVPDRAAVLAYYFLFALFPALLFLTALLAFLPVPNLMDTLMGYVDRVLPATAAGRLEQTVAEVTQHRRGGCSRSARFWRSGPRRREWRR